MRNVSMKVDGNKLVITVDLQVEGTPSASGKSLVIGSTEGNVSLNGRSEKVGVNVYRPTSK